MLGLVFFGMTVALTLGAWLTYRDLTSVVISLIVCLVGFGGGLVRYEYWRRKGRWFPGMGMYGASSDQTPPPEDAQRFGRS
jgi:hypothetical protein